jgi:hypothetical protein
MVRVSSAGCRPLEEDDTDDFSRSQIRPEQIRAKQVLVTPSPPKAARRTYADLLEHDEKTPPYAVNGEVTDFGRANYKIDDAATNARTSIGDGDKEVDPDIPQSITNVEVDEEGNCTPMTMTQTLTRINEATNYWPQKCGNVLFVGTLIRTSPRIDYLRDSTDLFAWLQSDQSIRGTIEWHKLTGCVGKDEVFREIRRNAKDWRAVESLPHEPKIPHHCYVCEDVVPTDGEVLRQLLDRFCPETKVDRDLILLMFATVFWGGPGGSRPTFVVDSGSKNSCGSGKSILTDMVSLLAGGAMEITENESIDVIKQRFLSPQGRSKRIARLDNVKSVKFSWSDLESMITLREISGKEMYVGEGARPNTITWLITFNEASFSTDLAQRSVLTKLGEPTRKYGWISETIAFIENNRSRIISDLIGFLQRPAKSLQRPSRWESWESQVLSKLDNPEAAQELIASRMANVDAGAQESAIVAEYFSNAIHSLSFDQDVSSLKINIPTKVVVEWYCKAMKVNWSVLKVNQAMRRLEKNLNCLSENRTHKHPGFLWTGELYRGGAVDYSIEDKLRELEKSQEQEKLELHATAYADAQAVARERNHILGAKYS